MAFSPEVNRQYKSMTIAKFRKYLTRLERNAKRSMVRTHTDEYLIKLCKDRDRIMANGYTIEDVNYYYG